MNVTMVAKVEPGGPCYAGPRRRGCAAAGGPPSALSSGPFAAASEEGEVEDGGRMGFAKQKQITESKKTGTHYSTLPLPT